MGYTGLAPLVFALLVDSFIPRLVGALGTGEFLCNGGARSGLACASDDDCVPNGVCVIALGVCDGGRDDSLSCECLGGVCSAQPVCSIDVTLGVCSGGILAAECCDLTFNCADQSPCVGSAKVCLGGENKAFACLRDNQCPASQCASTGKFCAGICAGGANQGALCLDDTDCPSSVCTSDYQNDSCVDDADCCVAAACKTGICRGLAAPPACSGDCNGGGSVTVDELLTMVNIILGTAPLSACPVGDANGDRQITINELVGAVGHALEGCGVSLPTAAPTSTHAGSRRKR
jgi:hypothetical protein